MRSILVYVSPIFTTLDFQYPHGLPMPPLPPLDLGIVGLDDCHLVAGLRRAMLGDIERIANLVRDEERRHVFKIAQLHDHIWCCRSGSAADTQALTDYVRHFLAQLAVETSRLPEVKVAAHLMRRLCYQNKDNLMAGVIVGGWDPVCGGTVYNIPVGGACIPMPFALGGSGSTFIYGLVDAEYRENMTKDEALALVKKAVSHAMARDGSSGGIIRTLVATEEGNVRDYVSGNVLPYGPAGW